MAHFTYTKVPDAVLDQLLGFTTLNSIKNSGRYIAEDVLGDPSANSDQVNAAAYTEDSADAVGIAMGNDGANAVIEQYRRNSGSTVGLRGFANSAIATSFSTTSTTLVNVTNLTVTIESSGKPIILFLGSPESSVLVSEITIQKGGNNSPNIGADIEIHNTTTSSVIVRQQFEKDFLTTTNTSHKLAIPSSCISGVEIAFSGTYTYQVLARTLDTNDTLTFTYTKLYAYEL